MNLHKGDILLKAYFNHLTVFLWNQFSTTIFAFKKLAALLQSFHFLTLLLCVSTSSCSECNNYSNAVLSTPKVYHITSTLPSTKTSWSSPASFNEPLSLAFHSIYLLLLYKWCTFQILFFKCCTHCSLPSLPPAFHPCSFQESSFYWASQQWTASSSADAGFVTDDVLYHHMRHFTSYVYHFPQFCWAERIKPSSQLRK